MVIYHRKFNSLFSPLPDRIVANGKILGHPFILWGGWHWQWNMFHLSRMTHSFPLRGTCQHHSSCLFRNRTWNKSKASATCMVTNEVWPASLGWLTPPNLLAPDPGGPFSVNGSQGIVCHPAKGSARRPEKMSGKNSLGKCISLVAGLVKLFYSVIHSFRFFYAAFSSQSVYETLGR